MSAPAPALTAINFLSRTCLFNLITLFSLDFNSWFSRPFFCTSNCLACTSSTPGVLEPLEGYGISKERLAKEWKAYFKHCIDNDLF